MQNIANDHSGQNEVCSGDAAGNEKGDSFWSAVSPCPSAAFAHAWPNKNTSKQLLVFIKKKLKIFNIYHPFWKKKKHHSTNNLIKKQKLVSVHSMCIL